uniref:Uncharacterized protein n=1 Tax=Junco hyemalis TaxID=40217 RepID=A0A8C5J796_JUNHY
MLRKIAVAAAAKPAVEIRQDGDGESFYIRTSTPVRTTEIRFRVGEEFEEQTVDGRPCDKPAGASWWEHCEVTGGDKPAGTFWWDGAGAQRGEEVTNLLGPLGGRGLVPSTALVWRARDCWEA